VKDSIEFVINSASAKKEALSAVMSIMSGAPIMVVTIEPYKRDRTKDQNKAYWKVILAPIEEATGTEAKLWHEFFKTLFVKPEFHTLCGITFAIKETTTKMTTKEFNEYIESIRRWTAEHLNITLPEIDSSKKEVRGKKTGS
jgi:hypothetical protein